MQLLTHYFHHQNSHMYRYLDVKRNLTYFTVKSEMLSLPSLYFSLLSWENVHPRYVDLRSINNIVKSTLQVHVSSCQNRHSYWTASLPSVFHKSNVATVLCLLFILTAAGLHLSSSISESDESLGFSACLFFSFTFLCLLPTGLILLSDRRSWSTLRSFRFLEHSSNLSAL